MLVETNYLVASAIEAPLVEAGYQVAVAVDVNEAFAILDGQEVHLALIDFRLQHAEPDGLVARLKQRNVPFIFCTAASLEEVYEYFPDVRIIQKPFSDDELLSAVLSLTAAQSSHRGA